MSGQHPGFRVGQGVGAPALRPCYRHASEVWIAYCPDCTVWHLAVQMTRRNALTAV